MRPACRQLDVEDLIVLPQTHATCKATLSMLEKLGIRVTNESKSCRCSSSSARSCWRVRLSMRRCLRPAPGCVSDVHSYGRFPVFVLLSDFLVMRTCVRSKAARNETKIKPHFSKRRDHDNETFYCRRPDSGCVCGVPRRQIRPVPACPCLRLAPSVWVRRCDNVQPKRRGERPRTTLLEYLPSRDHHQQSTPCSRVRVRCVLICPFYHFCVSECLFG